MADMMIEKMFDPPKIDGQIKGRRMTDAESMGMLFDDPLDFDDLNHKGGDADE